MPGDARRVIPLDVLAKEQYGCLHHRQVLAFVSRHVLNRRLTRGIYLPVRPGVVRLAAVADTHAGRAWAAYLSIGAPSALAGRSAALLHEIPDVRSNGDVSAVVPLHRAAPRQPGLTVRRVSGWSTRSWARRCGLPVSCLADTVIDLAAELSADQTRRLLEQLLWRRLSAGELHRRLSRGRAGSAAVRAALSELSDGHRSDAERRVAASLRRRGVPPFESNQVLRNDGGNPVAELDLLWRALRVAVMIDGWRYHRVETFQHDHDVPNWLTAGSDYVVLRFTGWDVTHRLPWVLEQIDVVLRRQARRLGVPYAA